MFKRRRHSINPVPLPDFLRRVSVSQIGRRMSLRIPRASSRDGQSSRVSNEDKVSSVSQPFLNRSFKRTTRSPNSGLDRTVSESGTFFRRTQSMIIFINVQIMIHSRQTIVTLFEK